MKTWIAKLAILTIWRTKLGDIKIIRILIQASKWALLMLR